MASKNRRIWLDALMGPRVEGGFSDHPEDNGGPTNYGITIKTLAAWRKRPVTVEEVKALTRDEAEAIAMAMYWNAIRGDMLPSGIDIYAADFAYNSGPETAAKQLQEVLSRKHKELKVDGFVGDATVSAVRQSSTSWLLTAYHDERMDYCMSLDDWPTFGKGWINRCNLMAKLARTHLATRPGIDDMLQSKTGWAALAATVLSWLPSSGLLPADLVGDPQLVLDQAQQLTGSLPLGEYAPIATGVLTLGIYIIRWLDWRTSKRAE